jgi:hypothetical protein
MADPAPRINMAAHAVANAIDFTEFSPWPIVAGIAGIVTDPPQRLPALDFGCCGPIQPGVDIHRASVQSIDDPCYTTHVGKELR